MDILEYYSKRKLGRYTDILSLDVLTYWACRLMLLKSGIMPRNYAAIMPKLCRNYAAIMLYYAGIMLLCRNYATRCFYAAVMLLCHVLTDLAPPRSFCLFLVA